MHRCDGQGWLQAQVGLLVKKLQAWAWLHHPPPSPAPRCPAQLGICDQIPPWGHFGLDLWQHPFLPTPLSLSGTIIIHILGTWKLRHTDVKLLIHCYQAGPRGLKVYLVPKSISLRIYWYISRSRLYLIATYINITKGSFIKTLSHRESSIIFNLNFQNLFILFCTQFTLLVSTHERL